MLLSSSSSSVHYGGQSGGALMEQAGVGRMVTYGAAAAVAQQTRHARRIYVGGIPPNYTNEDGLWAFINAVVAQAMGEENDGSYVLSVYINHKKCFAFVELKSIELAAACLQLDGIVFRNIVLRILRANEFKPELVPAHLLKPIRFDLSAFQFGTPNAPAHYSSADAEECTERCLDSLIDCSPLSDLPDGALALVGCPYEDSALRPHALRGTGCVTAPRSLRSFLRKRQCGSGDHAEDLSQLRMHDLGDVLPGLSSKEVRTSLTQTVAQIVLHGALPVVVGGSNDLALDCAAALLETCAHKPAVVMVSSQLLDVRLLEDARFCHGSDCEGRHVSFGAQGSQCSAGDVLFAQSRGGQIHWLTKHLRAPPARHSADKHFHDLLDSLPAPVLVVFDAGVLCSSLVPLANSSHSAVGLRLQEAAEIVRLAGAHPRVVAFAFTEFQTEELLLGELFYQFAVGMAQRPRPSPRTPAAASSDLPQALDLASLPVDYCGGQA